MARRLIGLAIFILAAWLLWQAGQAIAFFTQRGGSVMSALMEPPTGLVRVIGASLALVGGALAMFARPGGAPTALAGAIVFALLAGLMAMAGGASTLWRDEAVWAGILVMLAGALVFLHRKFNS